MTPTTRRRGIGRRLALGFGGAALLSALGAGRGFSQSATLAPEIVVADYREVSSELHYRGVGFGGAATASFRRLTFDLALARVAFDPADDAVAAESFDAQQLDVSIRFAVTGGVSAELGLMNRDVEPEFEAQSTTAVRLGARLSNLIGPGVRVGLRGHYLAGARFSGGGSATLGAEIGLSVAAEVLGGRLRFSADYEFQYFNRRTDDGTADRSVPMQQALLRVRAAVGF